MRGPGQLADFVAAQEPVYAEARRELSAGRKRTHWMWFVFPQLSGLGGSPMSVRFGIDSLEQARAYLAHPVLGARLRECTELMLAAAHDDVSAILDDPDDLKFHSSMTLFAAAAPDEPLFRRALEKFFGGHPDALTTDRLR